MRGDRFADQGCRLVFSYPHVPDLPSQLAEVLELPFNPRGYELQLLRIIPFRTGPPRLAEHLRRFSFVPIRSALLCGFPQS